MRRLPSCVPMKWQLCVSNFVSQLWGAAQLPGLAVSQLQRPLSSSQRGEGPKKTITQMNVNVRQ